MGDVPDTGCPYRAIRRDTRWTWYDGDRCASEVSMHVYRRTSVSTNNVLYRVPDGRRMTDNNTPAKTANPAPLGLLGFGMTTVLLSLHNMGIMPLDNVTLAMGVFCGGIAQMIAGIMEYRNGNTFGTVAFTLYGVFWLALVATRTDLFGAGSGGDTMGAFCLVWGIMTLFMFIGTLGGRASLKFVFLTLTVTFLVLTAADLSGIHTLTTVAGAVGLVCGASAMYTAFAEVLAEQHGRELLPF